MSIVYLNIQHDCVFCEYTNKDLSIQFNKNYQLIHKKAAICFTSYKTRVTSVVLYVIADTFPQMLEGPENEGGRYYSEFLILQIKIFAYMCEASFQSH